MIKIRPTANQADPWKHAIYLIKGLALHGPRGYVSDRQPAPPGISSLKRRGGSEKGKGGGKSWK